MLKLGGRGGGACTHSSAAQAHDVHQERRHAVGWIHKGLCLVPFAVLTMTPSVSDHSVDGPQRGASPRLWDMKVQVPPMFQEDTRKFQVPHSSLVKVMADWVIRIAH